MLFIDGCPAKFYSGDNDMVVLSLCNFCVKTGASLYTSKAIPRIVVSSSMCSHCIYARVLRENISIDRLVTAFAA